MSDGKIKVTWNDIEQKSNSGNAVEWSEISVPAEVSKKSAIGLGKIARIISIVAVCVMVAFFAFSSIKPDYKKPIETVLVNNKNIAKEVDGKSALEAVKAIVCRMRSINLSECPEDFQRVYQRHTEAWANLIPILQDAEKLSGWGNILKSAAIGFIGGYTGQFQLILGKIMSDINASDELQSAADLAYKEINSSFYEVLRMAQKYKVDTAPYSN